MSASNAQEIVRKYYGDFFSSNSRQVLSLLAPDVRLEFNQEAPLCGRDEFEKFLDIKERHYTEEMEGLYLFPNVSAGRVAAEFYVRGRYVATYPGLPEATGQPYKIRVGAFFEVEAGLIKRLTTYYSLTEWRRQVGIA